MLRHTLRSYLPAVLRQWWTYAGIAAGVVGYILDLIAGLKIPFAVWIGVFLGCLIVAQFLAYQQIHQRLLAFEAPRLPQWALLAHNANADGAWLTLLVVGDSPKKPLNTAIFAQLVSATVDQFGLDRGAIRVETFSGFLRIKFPNVDTTPEFLLQLGTDSRGIIGLQWRTTADPIPLAWILHHLDIAMHFTLSDAGQLVVRRPGKRKYSVSLSNWPQGGVSIEALLQARRLSDNYVRGSRVYREFTLTKSDSDGWSAICQFAAAVLGDSGYVEFEAALAALSRDSLKAA